MARPKISFELLEDRCQAKRWAVAGGPCGAKLLQVEINPEAAALLRAHGVRLTTGELICGNTGSACGISTGSRLKSMLDALR